MLYWLLLAALIILPVALRLWADDGPRSLERDEPPDSSDEDDPDRDLSMAA